MEDENSWANSLEYELDKVYTKTAVSKPTLPPLDISVAQGINDWQAVFNVQNQDSQNSRNLSNSSISVFLTWIYNKQSKRCFGNRFTVFQSVFVVLIVLSIILSSILIPTFLVPHQRNTNNLADSTPGSTSDSASPSRTMLKKDPQFPLSTSGRYIIDTAGSRIKLQCVSWPSHLETFIPEGLAQQPLDKLVALLASMGLNCVRFTYATQFATNSKTSVLDSINNANISRDSLQALQLHNNDIMSLSILDLYKSVFRKLEAAGLMVIMDNHVSVPKWCCQLNDGQRWWGDKDFSVQDWTSGLEFVASNFGSIRNVIGFGLRNEPGRVDDPKQLQNFMLQGARVVNQASPNSLVFMSGISFARNLSYETIDPIVPKLPFSKKFVYEAHQYEFQNNVTDHRSCLENQKNNQELIFNVLRMDYPLFLGEWGVSAKDFKASSYWLNCFLRDLLIHDVDNSVWNFASSYYRRETIQDYKEGWSLGNDDMSGPQSKEYLERISLLNLKRKHSILVSTLHGKCVTVINSNASLGNCDEAADSWTFRNGLLVHSSGMCLDKNLSLAGCSSAARFTDSSLGFKVDNSCLESSGGTLAVATCKEDELSQWFVLAPPTRS